MVMPVELAHAAYARPVLNDLLNTFRRTTLVTFRERLFPELGQDTLLLLAEGKGESPGKLLLSDLTSVADFDEEVLDSVMQAEEIDAEAIVNGRCTLASYWISREAKDLYEQLTQSEQTKRLGELAEVGVGYVTGANRFFHLSQEEVKARGITHHYLTPAVYRGRALSGLHFSKRDWAEAEKVGEAGYLFRVSSEKRLSKPVETYVSEGEARGVHQAYKCRVRSPWYSVPHVYEPDAFLSYMSGLKPLLVANDAEAVTPNSLHAVRLRSHTALSARALALLWQTSLTSLSVELEGHALGGGLLKLEPSEAKRVLLAQPEQTEFEAVFRAAFREVDALLRRGHAQDARTVADEVVLRRLLGLGEEEVCVLRQAANWLRDRRYYKGKRS